MSDLTRHSLLVRAREGEAGAWEDLCILYRPLILGWLRRQCVPDSDLDDLVQEILLAVLRGLPAFEHTGRRGAFRGWLRAIAHNHSCDYWKARARRATPSGGDACAHEALQVLEDPGSDLNRFWDEEHDRHILRCLLELVAIEFEPSTVRAFRLVALEGASGAEAATRTGSTVAAVHKARSRVLRRLRELAEGLLDDVG